MKVALQKYSIFAIYKWELLLNYLKVIFHLDLKSLYYMVALEIF